MSSHAQMEKPEPGTIAHLRAELERIANEHPNPHDARWIRGASSAIHGLHQRVEGLERKLAERTPTE